MKMLQHQHVPDYQHRLPQAHDGRTEISSRIYGIVSIYHLLTKGKPLLTRTNLSFLPIDFTASKNDVILCVLADTRERVMPVSLSFAPRNIVSQYSTKNGRSRPIVQPLFRLSKTWTSLTCYGNIVGGGVIVSAW